MAEPAKKPKVAAKRPLSEEAREKKRARDRARHSTSVNIGPAFTEWRELRTSQGLKTDAEVALFLLQS